MSLGSVAALLFICGIQRDYTAESSGKRHTEQSHQGVRWAKFVVVNWKCWKKASAPVSG